jgi:hypothetical protein
MFCILRFRFWVLVFSFGLVAGSFFVRVDKKLVCFGAGADDAATSGFIDVDAENIVHLLPVHKKWPLL